MKIKVIAVASNEAAYLPEWIHHHLYFGFDEIEIYVNRTSDNTEAVLQAVSERYPNVSFKIVDFLDLADVENIQRVAYSLALNSLTGEETHYIFLDIDEFWVSSDFQESVKDFMRGCPDADLVSFQWANKINDFSEFSLPFQVSNDVVVSDHVKTVVSSSVQVQKVFAHNVAADSVRNILANGEIFNRSPIYKVGQDQFRRELSRAFILHRPYRSEIEYISLLGKGRPRYPNKLKDNRPGFNKYKKENSSVFSVDLSLLEEYSKSFQSFLNELDLNEGLSVSRQFVIQRAEKVMALIAEQSPDSYEAFERCFSGVSRQPVKNELSVLKEKYVNYLRDEALRIEGGNLSLAFELMTKACHYRPDGGFIKAKIKEYASALGVDTNSVV
ncbi:glycosyltransferase family 2 protein [Microbulbifer sp. Q7]|uniref:glycosyltransferase family 2 protein n=1 Tax=Microbulbifer sp. Q7 TaxID=1785091 RepID=UPI00082C29D7|nr:glycosyltransferase family 2 protein [Microbulbifer sp. Q7]